MRSGSRKEVLMKTMVAVGAVAVGALTLGVGVGKLSMINHRKPAQAVGREALKRDFALSCSGENR